MFFDFDLSTLPVIKKVYYVRRHTVWQIVDPDTLLIFCTDGRCRITMDNNEYILNTGNLLIVPAGHHYLRTPIDDEFCTLGYVHLDISHSLIEDSDAIRLMHERKLEIDKAAFTDESLAPRHRYLCPLIVNLFDIREKADNIINKAIAESLKSSLCRFTSEALCIVELLIMIATKCQSEILKQKPDSSLPAKTVNSKLRTVFAYIRMHAHEDITVDELCKVCNFSKQHLTRLFNSEFKMPPKAYILNYKINCAKELFLRNSYLSVKEVANEMGFADQHYFSRIFTKIAGISPSAYKKHLINFDASKQ